MMGMNQHIRPVMGILDAVLLSFPSLCFICQTAAHHAFVTGGFWSLEGPDSLQIFLTWRKMVVLFLRNVHMYGVVGDDCG